MLKTESLQQQDVEEASSLIIRSFTDAVAPALSSKGVESFMPVASPAAIAQRLAAGNPFLVCKAGTALAGVGEIRDSNHLNLLFVEPGLQGRGIGRTLFLGLLDRIPARRITVNASLNAVGAYRIFGFRESGPAQEAEGMRFQPMVYERQ